LSEIDTIFRFSQSLHAISDVIDWIRLDYSSRR